MSRDVASCLIGLGSNLGDRAGYLDQAVAALRAHPDIRNLVVSSYRSTKPAGGPAGQSEFLNAAARAEASLAPHALLAELHRIEASLGRTRDAKWSARTIDLDLLLYDSEIIETESLVVPHPRMTFRRFVLEPAAEIAGEMRYPIHDLPIHFLLAHLGRLPNYIAMTGGRYAVRARAAKQAADMVGGRYLPDPVGPEFESYVLGTAQPAGGRQREILRLRKKTVRAAMNESSEIFTVSDFCIVESFALAEARQPSLERSQLKLLRNETGVWDCVPKLLIVVGTRFPGDWFFGDTPEYDRALIEQAKSFGMIPPLTLPTNDPNIVAEEVAAAVWAMQK